MTRDTWHMTHSVGRTFSQNFSSLALPVWDWQCLEYISTNHELMNQSVDDGGDCRTAPATPGLLNICQKILRKLSTSMACISIGAKLSNPPWIIKQGKLESFGQWLINKILKKTRCSRGCFTNTFLIGWLIYVTLFLHLHNTFILKW